MNRIPYEKRAEIKDPYMTLQQIADIMGISREAVRQIEQTALRKARKVLRSKNMSLEDFVSTLRYAKPIKQGEVLSDSTEYELIEPETGELNDR